MARPYNFSLPKKTLLISSIAGKRLVGSNRVWREMHLRKLVRPVSASTKPGMAAYYLRADIDAALVRMRDAAKA